MSGEHADLIARLDAAVEGGSPEAITARVKHVLQEILGQSALRLPARFRQTSADTYARRLLHRDPAGRYTAVVMTWGRGQGTPIHDHGGLWCVELVVEGQMSVTQYDVWPGPDGTYRAAPHGSVIHAGIGTAGHLIPPVDYHVLANDQPEPSITLHVYGGELNTCRVFHPVGGGRYQEELTNLTYRD